MHELDVPASDTGIPAVLNGPATGRTATLSISQFIHQRQIIAQAPILVAPGLHGSGEDHWQTAWERWFPNMIRIQQDDWDMGDLRQWSDRVADAVSQAPQPVFIVAHSFGCLATVHASQRLAAHIAGALLVAPAHPHRFNAGHLLPATALPYPATMVLSDNDPWLPAPLGAALAQQWQCHVVRLGAVGHINTEAGFTEWQAGLDLLAQLIHCAQYGKG